METARIAQLVARQRSSKRKTGRQVNCQMRVKKTMPFFLEGSFFHVLKLLSLSMNTLMYEIMERLLAFMINTYLLPFVCQGQNPEAIFPFEIK